MTLRDEQKLGAARITDLASCKALARQSRRIDVSGPSLCGPYSLLDAPSASHLDRIARGDRFFREAALPQLSYSTSHSPLRRRRESNSS